jgi:hypothetical protein
MDVVLWVNFVVSQQRRPLMPFVSLSDMHAKEGKPMISLLADVGSGYFFDLSGGSIGLSGPIGLGDAGGGDGVGLSGGVGLSYDAGSEDSIGLNGGVGLFA